MSDNNLELNWWGVYWRGVAIGGADLVPGVSGGTIAFITGIYSRVLSGIKIGSSLVVWLLLLRGNLKIFWKTVDGNFFAFLLAGIATAILLGIEVLHWLLTSQLIPLLAFFTGLTLGAAFNLLRTNQIKDGKLFLLTAVGIIFAWAIQSFDPVQFSSAPSLQAYFISGAIAICVMILPGISGSLMLLLLGIYPHLVEAVHDRDIAVMVVFVLGCIIGLALFARLILRMMLVWRLQTISVLVGVMLGSLPRLWPWREQTDAENAILAPTVWPTEVDDAKIVLAIVCVIVGLGLIEVTSYLGKRFKK